MGADMLRKQLRNAARVVAKRSASSARRKLRARARSSSESDAKDAA